MRLTSRIAAIWSIARMCRDTTRLDSIARKSARHRSFRSEARMEKKLTSACFLPIPKVRLSRKSKLDGAMKSLVDSPEGASHFQSKRKGACVSMWNMSCMSLSRSLPSSGAAATPSRLKLFSKSISMRSSLGFAALMPSASMPKVMNLVLVRPLLPLACWVCSMSAYSCRISSLPSSRSGIRMLCSKTSLLAVRLRNENCR